MFSHDVLHFDYSFDYQGMRWQVPWGKHTPAHYKYEHAAKMATSINKDDVLPVITIRNPYQWMKSMCKNPYAAKWPHHPVHNCPHLILEATETWNAVTVTYGAGSEQYPSLAHLFNDWYHEYTHNASYPWIMIRMEGESCYSTGDFFVAAKRRKLNHKFPDLIFYTKETITKVCQCAGGRIRTDRPFVYTVKSAKGDSPGHDTSVGFYEAWIRYSQPAEPLAGFKEDDYRAANSVLDTELMRIFGYDCEHPPVSS